MARTEKGSKPGQSSLNHAVASSTKTKADRLCLYSSDDDRIGSIDFHQAMPGTSSKPMYEEFLLGLGRAYKPEKIKGASYAWLDAFLCAIES